jgi:hypothetical protein
MASQTVQWPPRQARARWQRACSLLACRSLSRGGTSWQQARQGEARVRTVCQCIVAPGLRLTVKVADASGRRCGTPRRAWDCASRTVLKLATQAAGTLQVIEHCRPVRPKQRQNYASSKQGLLHAKLQWLHERDASRSWPRSSPRRA